MVPTLTASYSNKAFTVDAQNDSDRKKSDKVKDETPFEFDDLLPHIGEFGIYQKLLFLMMIPFAFFVAWVYFTQIFITINPEEHWCWIPELENLTVEDRKLLAIPQSNGGFDKCSMYNINFTDILHQGIKIADSSWEKVPCKNGWEYNFTDVPYKTIASDLDWVCDQATLPTLAQAIFFGGAILGGLVFGWVADRYGRIPALVGTNMVGFIGGIATAFCTTFWTFSLCRFLVGMAFDNCFTMMYILVLEYVGPRWRTFVANMSIAIFFTFAASVLPWIALAVADWKMLCIATSAPLIISLLTPWFVPESARWLVSQGKVEKAIRILRKFEKINKTKIEESLYKEFEVSCTKALNEEESNKNYSVLDLFRTPRLRKIMLLLIVIWMAISLTFDGHVRNVGSLGLDIFLTFTIASVTEFPADTFLTFVLDLWGRRWLAFGSMVISGIFSLLATAVPYGIPSASMAIIGRFAINISYNIGLQYAAELLPTVVRAQGVALIHIMGYVASILAPFIVYLANISPSLPLLILGILGVVGGILALFLPETLDHELPQTLQDGENFGLHQKFLDFPCTKKKTAEEKTVNRFTRSSIRASTRASFRGEIRSSIIHRASVRSRKSIAAAESAVV
ncbi:Sugar transporter [Popillia japonica]|uniref:Sugar transporter n=2 Tax=Popillia japonica TaxID=7064 RepID=A0AAW1MEZ3_POPJA